MTKIFIDPGHGGTDPGAIGNGLQEKNLTLTLSLKIQSLLSAYDVSVQMSRNTDKTVSLNERTNMANAWGADYFLSIHVNAGGGTGWENYIYNGTVSAQTVAVQKAIHDGVMEAISSYGVRDRGMKQANFHVLRETRMPASLSENLFIDTTADANLLKNSAFLDALARGHVNGLVAAFSLRKKAATEPLYRVVIDGTQVGAFQAHANILRAVEQALGQAQEIRVERVSS